MYGTLHCADLFYTPSFLARTHFSH